MRLRLVRVRVAHDVAIDVAARRHGVQERRVDRLHAALEVALDHAVELERLARGEPQRAVGVVGRDPVHREPLGGRAHAAGHAHPDHERIRLLHLLLAPLGAQVAVVLQIGAVELGQLGVVLGDRAGLGLGQAIRDAAAQEAARLLDLLVLRWCCGHGVRSSADCARSTPDLSRLGSLPGPVVERPKPDPGRRASPRAISIHRRSVDLALTIGAYPARARWSMRPWESRARDRPGRRTDSHGRMDHRGEELTVIG